MPKAENYHTEEQNVAGVGLKITSYQIGDRFYCHIENKDPGAVIARAEGTNRKEAVQLAFAKARKRVLPGMSSSSG